VAPEQVPPAPQSLLVQQPVPAAQTPLHRRCPLGQAHAPDTQVWPPRHWAGSQLAGQLLRLAGHVADCPSQTAGSSQARAGERQIVPAGLPVQASVSDCGRWAD
jgi:hypothetical protein